MEAMKEMGESIKAIAQMVTGKSPLVADGVKAGARLIAGPAGENHNAVSRGEQSASK